MGDPTAEIKRQWTIGGDPFTVELTGYMQVRARSWTTFAGGMSDWITLFQVNTCLYLILIGDVHVQDRPTGLLLPVARKHLSMRIAIVEILYDIAITAAHHRSIRDCDRPGFGGNTTAPFCRRC